MEKSIKETLELLNGLKKLAVAGKKIASNGKIDASDLVVVIDLVKDMESISESIKGAGDIPSELKDLDQAEVLSIIAKLYEISEEISNA